MAEINEKDIINKEVNSIINNELFLKVIKEARKYKHGRGWVFDELEGIICDIDDTSELGSIIFDRLEDIVDKSLK